MVIPDWVVLLFLIRLKHKHKLISVPGKQRLVLGEHSPSHHVEKSQLFDDLQKVELTFHPLCSLLKLGHPPLSALSVACIFAAAAEKLEKRGAKVFF